jgi:hypothetical protein
MSRYFKMPSPQTVEIAGVKWREHYQCYMVKLVGVLELSFTYRTGLFDVMAMGQLIGAADNVEAAAQMAIAEARRINAALTKRLADIPEVTDANKS